MTFTFTFPTLPFKAGEGLEKEGADTQDAWGTSASNLGRPGESADLSLAPSSAALTAESGLPGSPVRCQGPLTKC